MEDPGDEIVEASDDEQTMTAAEVLSKIEEVSTLFLLTKRTAIQNRRGKYTISFNKENCSLK